MTLQCDNCNQPILPADTVCWHCGKELTPTQLPKDPKSEADNAADSETSDPISITAVSIFALITLITIILIIIVTNALARYPAL